MIDGEFESFVEKFNENKIENEKFVETDDYEFEYSHNEICEAQENFGYKVREFLKEKAPGKYCVSVDYDWCVRVVSIEYAREHMLSLEECLVR
jgi:hypothetical protein